MSCPHLLKIVTENSRYTSKLGAGLGLIDETRSLLELWEPGMAAPQLLRAALESGRFTTITARRLRLRQLRADLLSRLSATRNYQRQAADARLDREPAE
jgi:hypothetical protein